MASWQVRTVSFRECMDKWQMAWSFFCLVVTDRCSVAVWHLISILFLRRLALITLMWTTMARSMVMNYGHSLIRSTGFTWSRWAHVTQPLPCQGKVWDSVVPTLRRTSLMKHWKLLMLLGFAHWNVSWGFRFHLPRLIMIRCWQQRSDSHWILENVSMEIHWFHEICGLAEKLGLETIGNSWVTTCHCRIATF